MIKSFDFSQIINIIIIFYRFTKVAAVLETTIRSKPSETKITGRLESLDDDFGHCGLDDNVIYNEAYDKAFEKLESLKTANGRKLPSMASKKDLKYTKSSSNSK